MIRNLSLIGGGIDSCIIDIGVSPSYDTVVVMRDSCLLSGFWVRASNTDRCHGIFAHGNGISVKGNKISNGNFGVLSENSGIVLVSNFFMNNKIGMYLYNSNSLLKFNLITTNIFGGVGIDISAFWTIVSSTIDSNHIDLDSEGSKGIWLNSVSKPSIRNNMIVLRDEFSDGYIGGGEDTTKIFNNAVISTGNSSLGIEGFSHLSVAHITSNNLVIGHAESGMTVTAYNSYSTRMSNNLIIGSYYGIDNTGPYVNAHYNNIWRSTINYHGFTADSTNIIS